VAQGHGALPTDSAVTQKTHRRRSFYAASSRDYSDHSWYAWLDTDDRDAFDPGRAADPDYATGDDASLVDS
jgi:hypothetical protein